jgi:transcriptional regulator with XRE-family HTH domain
MDDLNVGTVVRSVRRRRGWRQLDVASKAGVGQWAVSTIERGDLERLPVRTVRRVCAALKIRIPFAPRWRGGDLPRLIDQSHAALVERVAAILAPLGWETTVEYTFGHYGEIGAVDLLAWHVRRRALLIVEVKSEVDDLQRMLSVLDRKTRLVPKLVAAERGWQAATIGIVLVMRECSTGRCQVARHRATFASALPGRNLEVRRWVESPGPEGLRGIWFLQSSDGATLIEGTGTAGGPRRIRKPRSQASATRK